MAVRRPYICIDIPSVSPNQSLNTILSALKIGTSLSKSKLSKISYYIAEKVQKSETEMIADSPADG